MSDGEDLDIGGAPAIRDDEIPDNELTSAGTGARRSGIREFRQLPLPSL
jgi:hypothetical protein